MSPVGVFIMGSCRGASPSPSGRGWPEGPGEGRLVKNVAHSGPHPPLRGTLSQRERDSLQPLPIIANVQTPVSLREQCCPNCLAPLSGCALASERNPECRSAPLRANFLAALTGCVSARRRRDGILARGERAIASHPGFYRSTQNCTPKGVRGARST